MPTLTKRELIRRARDLMNANGLHWIKGEYQDEKWVDEKGTSVTAYCMMGGLRKVLFGSGRYLPSDPDEQKEYLDTAEMLASIIQRRFPERVENAHASDYEGIVIAFNDHKDTTWEEVRSVLTEGALDKAKQAHAPEPRPIFGSTS